MFLSSATVQKNASRLRLYAFTFAALTSLSISSPTFAALPFDAQIRADGSAQNFDLSGRDGIDGQPGFRGRDGRDGRDAYCPDPKGPRKNGEDGEDGQDGYPGRNGEDGQDGGDALIYFEELANLKLISIRSQGGEGGYGGRGGPGGRGGRGGWGCNGGWRGRDGWDGRPGADGRMGSRGDRGQIYLKQGFEPLQPSQTRVSLTIREFFSSTVTLRKNFWRELTGANAILAPGSVVVDRYSEYLSTNQITAAGVLNWDQTPSETVLNQVISLQFNEPFTEPTIEFGNENIIVFFSREQQGSHFIYKIDSIYNADDYFHFRAGIRGEIGKDRRILISDLKTNWKALPTELTIITIRGSKKQSYPIPESAIRLSSYGPEIMLAKVAGLKGQQGTTFDKVLVRMKRNLKGRIIQREFTVKGGSL